MSELASGFNHWAIVELMGHVKIAGKVQEVELFGSKLGRVDIPDGNGGLTTQYFNGSSLYRLTPTTEEIARGFAIGNQPEPVYKWEIKSLNAAPESEASDDFDCRDYPI